MADTGRSFWLYLVLLVVGRGHVGNWVNLVDWVDLFDNDESCLVCRR